MSYPRRVCFIPQLRLLPRFEGFMLHGALIGAAYMRLCYGRGCFFARCLSRLDGVLECSMRRWRFWLWHLGLARLIDFTSHPTLARVYASQLM